MCACPPASVLNACKGQKRALDTLHLKLHIGCEMPCVCSESNLGPLEVHWMRLTS